MCTILLFKDCFDNTIYRWLKELGNISPKILRLDNRIKANINDLPHQFQLTKANIAFLVIVPSRSKLDVFRLMGVPKPKFGCLVKTTDDMLQIIEKR
jgi:hypothetical protein